MTLTIRRLAADAGYQPAGLRDLPALLGLAGRSERVHPGLLGRASRRWPVVVTRPLVLLAAFGSAVAGVVVFDPAGAAVVMLPVNGVGRRRASTVVAVAANTVVGFAVLCGVSAVLAGVTRFGFADISLALGLVLGLVFLACVPRLLEQAAVYRTAVQAAEGEAVISAAAYFGVAPATGAMAAGLLAAADRHQVWVSLQTSGPARIRLYRRFGFVVVTVPDPVTARREPRVFMLRQPAGVDGKLVEADPALWQRPRPGSRTRERSKR